jgi:hypothetical protein
MYKVELKSQHRSERMRQHTQYTFVEHLSSKPLIKSHIETNRNPVSPFLPTLCLPFTTSSLSPLESLAQVDKDLAKVYRNGTLKYC